MSGRRWCSLGARGGGGTGSRGGRSGQGILLLAATVKPISEEDAEQRQYAQREQREEDAGAGEYPMESVMELLVIRHHFLLSSIGIFDGDVLPRNSPSAHSALGTVADAVGL